MQKLVFIKYEYIITRRQPIKDNSLIMQKQAACKLLAYFSEQDLRKYRDQ